MAFEDTSPEVAGGAGEEGVASVSEFVGDVGELLAVAAGVEAEGFEQVRLRMGKDGDGERAGGFDERGGVVGV